VQGASSIEVIGKSARGAGDGAREAQERRIRFSSHSLRSRSSWRFKPKLMHRLNGHVIHNASTLRSTSKNDAEPHPATSVMAQGARVPDVLSPPYSCRVDSLINPPPPKYKG
jgi:hypothetical protein